MSIRQTFQGGAFCCANLPRPNHAETNRSVSTQERTIYARNGGGYEAPLGREATQLMSSTPAVAPNSQL